jgi:diketogulonate reductase-like aldo/keto reductase
MVASRQHKKQGRLTCGYTLATYDFLPIISSIFSTKHENNDRNNLLVDNDMKKWLSPGGRLYSQFVKNDTLLSYPTNVFNAMLYSVGNAWRALRSSNEKEIIQLLQELKHAKAAMMQAGREMAKSMDCFPANQLKTLPKDFAALTEGNIGQCLLGIGKTMQLFSTFFQFKHSCDQHLASIAPTFLPIARDILAINGDMDDKKFFGPNIHLLSQVSPIWRMQSTVSRRNFDSIASKFNVVPRYKQQYEFLSSMRRISNLLLSNRMKQALLRVDVACDSNYKKTYGSPKSATSELSKEDSISKDHAIPFIFVNSSASPDAASSRWPLIGMGLGCGGIARDVTGDEDDDAETNMTDDAKTNVTNVISAAIEHGVRLFDTAELYGNEDLLGTAIERSGISRNKFIILTKQDSAKFPMNADNEVFDDSQVERHVRSTLDTQLQRLKTDYVDGMQLHHGVASEKIIEVYYMLQQEGKIRVVFHPSKKSGTIAAADNFDAGLIEDDNIKRSRFARKFKLRETYQEQDPRMFNQVLIGIIPFGDFPENNPSILSTHVMLMGERYGKTPYQIVLRYGVEMGFVSIPCSHREKHVVANSPDMIKTFSLTVAEQKLLLSHANMWTDVGL